MRKSTLSKGKNDQLENNPRFLARIEAARRSLRQGRGLRLDDLDSKPRRPSWRTHK